MTERTTTTRVYDAEQRMPPVRPYLRETIAHLQFAYEKARLDLKAAHRDTWFGRLWNIINPMLLGVVYWLLVMVIFDRAGDGASGLQVFAQILGGLFLFSLPSGAINAGARSIVGGGTFVLNTRLPRLILPIGAVITAIITFLPSLAVYAVIHLIVGFPIGPELLWAIPIILLVATVSLGLAAFFATLNVYFRDVASFLPYVTRIWMYLSPVIYLYTLVPERFQWGLNANPIGGAFAAWQQAVYQGTNPSLDFMLSAVAWALVLLVGGVLLFMRKERDFAVRL